MNDEKPWIVSLSDIESNYDFFVESLDLVGNAYGNPIVNFEGDKMNWAGNNYKLIINGDLFQHSRLENPQTKDLASALKNLVESAPKGSVMFTVGNHDVGMFIERYKNPNKEEMDGIGEFAKDYTKWIEKDIVKPAIPGYNFTYVHAGQMNEWTESDYQEADKLLKELNGRSLKSLGLEYVVSNRGENDVPLSSIPFRDLSKKEKIQKLIGIGNTAIGNGTGKNPHAGIIWIRAKMLKQGPPQIVGHTGFKRPWRYNDLILENTQAGSLKQPSVVVEKPHGVYGVTDKDGEYKL